MKPIGYYKACQPLHKGEEFQKKKKKRKGD